MDETLKRLMSQNDKVIEIDENGKVVTPVHVVREAIERLSLECKLEREDPGDLAKRSFFEDIEAVIASHRLLERRVEEAYKALQPFDNLQKRYRDERDLAQRQLALQDKLLLETQEARDKSQAQGGILMRQLAKAKEGLECYSGLNDFGKPNTAKATLRDIEGMK